MNHCGVIYEFGVIRKDFGICILQNHELSAKYFKKAAERGDNYGLFNYGQFLYKGIGVSENQKEGLKYLKLAADQGNIDAMYVCGIILSENAALFNICEAAKYLKMAADLDDQKSLELYCCILLKFKQIETDKKKIAQYLKKIFWFREWINHVCLWSNAF